MRYILSCVAGVAVSLTLFLMMTYLIDKHDAPPTPPTSITPDFYIYKAPEPEPSENKPIEPPSVMDKLPSYEPPVYPKPKVNPIDLSAPSPVRVVGTDIPTVNPQPPVLEEVAPPDLTVLVGSKVKYPENAMRRNLEGYVVVENVVDKYGKVIDVRVLESSHRVFENAARNSVFKWKYSNSELNKRVDRKRIAFKIDD